MSDEKPADWATANNEDWLNQKIKPGSSKENPVQHIKHKELKLATPESSLYKTVCPACNFGWLLIYRNPKPPHELMPGDQCKFCGQQYIYDDIDDLRKIENSVTPAFKGTTITGCNVCPFARIGYCELEQYAAGSASIYTMEGDKAFRSDIPKECPAKHGLPFSIRFDSAVFKAKNEFMFSKPMKNE